MKKFLIGVCLLLCSFAPAYAATVNVVVDPPADPLAISIGETFTVTVSNTDFVQTGGATLDIIWSAAILDLVSISIAPGGFWQLDPGTPSAAQQTAGVVDGFSIFGDLFAPENDPVGNFDSFVLEFIAQATGSSTITIDENIPAGGWIASSDFTQIPGVIYNQGSVTVAAVPVPASVWLFGSALGVLGWIRRRAA